MDFFTGFGFASNLFSNADLFYNKLKRSDADWKAFLSFIKKIVIDVCKEYSSFIEVSPDHKDIYFVKEYEELLYESLCGALVENRPFTLEMVLPFEDAFPTEEKQRLYQLLRTRLMYSFEYVIRNSQNEIQNQLQILMGHVEEMMSCENKVFASVKETQEDVIHFLRLNNISNHSFSNDNRNIELAYEQAYKNAIHFSHAYDIVPNELFQRDNELELLEKICQIESGYFLFQAKAYTGKSGLLSWFFLHPPKDIWIVGYFLIRRIGLSSSKRFEASIKSQLIALILLSDKEEQHVELRKKTIVQLLQEAAMIGQKYGKRLVLVVDGLDEEISENYDNPSVLNLLPKKNIPNLIVILSCRPNPNVFDNTFLPSDHEARNSIIYDLSQSQYVKDIQILSQSELQKLYDDEKTKKIIALLAVSQGVLTVTDLCMITNTTYQIDIKKIFEGSMGRIFMSVMPESGITMMEETEKGYTFAHDILQKQALNDLVGNNYYIYIGMLSEWCENYQNQKWPLDTPLYLLTDYLGLLSYNAQWDKLANLLVNYDFVRLVSQKNISCSLYFDLIRETIAGLSKEKSIDFTRIGLLSETREMLALRDDNIPIELPILFAKLGQFDAALKMTETMTEVDRLLSLSQIAVIMAKKGNAMYAVSTAQSVIDAISFEMYSNQHPIKYNYNKYLSKCAEAFVISGYGSKAESFFNRLVTTLNLDERFKHGKNDMMFFYDLQEIILATAKAGEINVALREVELFTFDWQMKGFTLAYLGVLQALQGDFEGAIKSAENAYLTNYYNDGQYMDEGRRGNEHIILECAKILKIIEMLSKVNGINKVYRNYRLKIVFPIDGQIKYLSFENLLNESNVHDYWNRFIGKMYVEIADEFLNIGLRSEALELVEIANFFFKKYRTEYKYAKLEDTYIELVQIVKIEASCLNIDQALLPLQEMQDIDKIIEAYTVIASNAYKNGAVVEAGNALFIAKQKMKECHELNTILKVVLSSALIEGAGAAIAMSPELSTVKESVMLLCKLAEERLADHDIKGAEMIAKDAFFKLSSSDYNLVSLDKYHLKKHVYNPIDISKSLFDIGEYELAIKIAAISGEEKWHAKLLMKTAQTILDNNKYWAMKLFDMALDIIKKFKIEIDVNKKEHSEWGDGIYEKDEPTIMDFVIMSRELMWLGDEEGARSILPPYSEFSKMLWQSTNLYAYEGLYIYFVLGDKGKVEKDLITVCNSEKLKYAKAWLAVVKDEFTKIDFSNITFSFSRDEKSHVLSVSYDDKHSNEWIIREYGVDIPVDFYKSLERLSELYRKCSTLELNELIASLAVPYDGGNHYGKQMNWSVRMILLIRKLHEIGILNQNKALVSDFEKFLSKRNSVRDNLVCLWCETLIFIDSPVEDVIENIKITYNKKYDGEHYNPDRPNIVRALTAVLKKYPNHVEAIGMIKEVCRAYIENTYSHDYSVFIEAQQSLNIDLGLKEAFLSALQSKPWYDMIDLFAFFDLQALRRVTQISYDRIAERMKSQVSKEKSPPLHLNHMSESTLQ